MFHVKHSPTEVILDRFHTDTVPICDYEGSDYRTRFWTDQGRAYEDLAERIAIRRLLPPRGERLLEVGTGFGRLVDLYQGYKQILLLDYSKSMLREAQARLGPEPKYIYVAADLYQLPLVDSLVDTVSMVRVIHHLVNVPRALGQIHRVVRPEGTFLLEFASKLHLKSILRYAVRRQSWSPFAPEPVEFVELNLNFHPQWMKSQLRDSGFSVVHVRTVSRFRIPFLKRLVPAPVLARLDGSLQWVGELWQLTPSVFVRAQRQGAIQEKPSEPATADPVSHFRCPSCQDRSWQAVETELRCQSCGARWGIDGGIYDFRKPL